MKWSDHLLDSYNKGHGQGTIEGMLAGSIGTLAIAGVAYGFNAACEAFFDTKIGERVGAKLFGSKILDDEIIIKLEGHRKNKNKNKKERGIN